MYKCRVTHMQGVLDLPGLTKKHSWPLYFCIRPDAETAERMLRVQGSILSDLAGTWSPTRRERLHLSLLLVEIALRIRPAARYGAVMAARRVAMSPFEVCCREAVSFAPLRRDGDSPLVLRAESPAIAELHRQLRLAMSRPGCTIPTEIAPHVTLARGAQRLPSRAIEPIRFTVRDFALVWSAEAYQVVEIFPLGG